MNKNNIISGSLWKSAFYFVKQRYFNIEIKQEEISKFRNNPSDYEVTINNCSHLQKNIENEYHLRVDTASNYEFFSFLKSLDIKYQKYKQYSTLNKDLDYFSFTSKDILFGYNIDDEERIPNGMFVCVRTLNDRHFLEGKHIF